MGRIFEDICIQYMIRRNKTLSLPIMFNQIGRWWGNNPYERRQEEIDIIAKSEESVIFGECEWENELIDLEKLFQID